MTKKKQDLKDVSKEKDVEQMVEQQVKSVDPEPETESIDINSMKAGYLVGLEPDGNFKFHVFGNEVGVVELTGVHSYATRQVNDAIDAREGRNKPLILELAKLVQHLDKKLTHLVNTIDPPKPANKL